MDIFIIGGGGFSAEVIEAILASQPNVKLTGIFDDDTRLAKTNSSALPYLGTIEEFICSTSREAAYVLAIGDNAVREQLDTRFITAEKRAVTVVHPTAVVSSSSSISDGTYIAAFSFIGPNTVIGRHGIINVGASIGHNAVLDEYVQICPGARVSGFVEVGRGAFLASNSTVAPGVKLGAGVKLAANSFAIKSLPDRAFAAGVPARVF